MIRKSILSVILLLLSWPAPAEQRKRAPELHGALETALELERRVSEQVWAFDFPLYGELNLQYKSDRVQSRISFDYFNGAAVGDTYIMGLEGNSSLKLGYFREKWGEGYSASIVDILNEKDSRYPDNIFYHRVKSPNPLVLLSLESRSMREEIALSQQEEIESIHDTLLGFRGRYLRPGLELDVGMIRAIGYPPPLFFLTARRETELYQVWSEIGFRYYRDSSDRWDAVFGVRRALKTAMVLAEFSLLHSRPQLFLEERLSLTEEISFSLSVYTYLETMSSALNGSFSVALDEKTSTELGAFLFFGKEGSYFSRYEGDNHNAVYLKLRYEF